MSTSTTAATIKVGIIYSRTGLLSAYGAEYISGLRLGLRYATNGTNKVNGNDVQFTLVDDAGDPTKAVTAAKDLIGQGFKIIAGTVSSGVALQLGPLAEQNKILYISGPAASDAITGLNRYTFRSGRQTYQDVLAAQSFLGSSVGRKIVVFAQDSAFGAGNFAAATPARRQGPQVEPDPGPAVGDRLHPSRSSEGGEPRPALRRLCRQTARHVAGARPAKRSTQHV